MQSTLHFCKYPEQEDVWHAPVDTGGFTKSSDSLHSEPQAPSLYFLCYRAGRSLVGQAATAASSLDIPAGSGARKGGG